MSSITALLSSTLLDDIMPTTRTSSLLISTAFAIGVDMPNPFLRSMILLSCVYLLWKNLRMSSMVPSQVDLPVMSVSGMMRRSEQYLLAGLISFGASKIFISPETQAMTSSLVTRSVLDARLFNTISVNATGSLLDIMSSKASGERSRFLLAASVSTSCFDIGH